MRKYLLLLIIPLLFISSCKKATVKPTVYYASDYMPFAPGSTWSYRITPGYKSVPFDPDSVTMTMTADHIDKDGKTFYIVTANNTRFNGTDKFYFAKSDGQFKLYSSILRDYLTGEEWDLPILPDSRFLHADSIYLLPNTNPALPPPYQIATGYTNKDAAYTVSGITFQHTISADVTLLKYYDGPDPKHIGDYYLYESFGFILAPDIGIIQESTDYQIISLTSYNIKH